MRTTLPAVLGETPARLYHRRCATVGIRSGAFFLEEGNAEKVGAWALGASAVLALAAGLALPATAQDAAKPNILFIMGDDIG